MEEYPYFPENDIPDEIFQGYQLALSEYNTYQFPKLAGCVKTNLGDL